MDFIPLFIGLDLLLFEFWSKKAMKSRFVLWLGLGWISAYGIPPAQQHLWFTHVYTFEAAIQRWQQSQHLDVRYTYRPIRQSVLTYAVQHQTFQCFAVGYPIVHAVLQVHLWPQGKACVHGEVLRIPQPALPTEGRPAVTEELVQRLKGYLPEGRLGALCWYAFRPDQTAVLAYAVHKGQRSDVVGYIQASVAGGYTQLPQWRTLGCGRTSWSLQRQPPEVGWAQTRFSGLQPLATTFVPHLGGYVLHDAQRQLTTYNCRGDALLRNQHFVDADNQWTAAEWNNAQRDQAALDAHWGLARVHDFWQQVLGVKIVQPPLYNFVHFDPNPYDQQSFDNAAWDGEQWVYGDGTGENPLTAFDIVAHEYAHAVIQHAAALLGHGPAGELGEALADIWAACASQYQQYGHLHAEPDSDVGDHPVWSIGEACRQGGYRSLSDPLRFGQPATYRGLYYEPDPADVHHNSSVLSHWFYVLSTQGLGMERAAALVLELQSFFLTPHAHIIDICYASLGWVYVQYGPQSHEWHSVVAAWKAVELWEGMGQQFVAQLPMTEAPLWCTPNPAVHELTVMGTLAVAQPAQLRVWDQQGRKLREVRLPRGADFFEQKIEISDLQSGVYFIELQGENQRQSTSFVKQ